MTIMATEKALRNEEATRQEQAEVKAQKDKGNVAYRIAREIDTLTVDKNGTIWLCDCKHTENGDDVFYLDSKDVAKGLDEVLKWRSNMGDCGVPVRFRIDMFFKRHRSNNHKYIPITEFDRGYSIKVTRGKKKITTARVGNGQR